MFGKPTSQLFGTFFSDIFSWGSSAVSSVFSGGYALIIAGAVSIGLITGAFFYGEHVATASDKTAIYQAISEQQAAELATMQKQFADAQVVIQNLQNQGTKVRTITRTVVQKIPTYIKDNRSCDLPSPLVDYINEALSVNSSK